MKSAASQQPQPSSSSKVSEEAPRKRGSTEDLNVDQIKVPKVVINPWKVTADQLQHIQKSEMAEYSFDHPECLQTSVEAFKSLKEKNNRYRFTTENNYVRSIKWFVNLLFKTFLINRNEFDSGPPRVGFC